MIRYQITDGTGQLATLSRDVDFIQIREPGLTTRELAAFVREALRIGPRILVNNRIDVAIATGAAGVHLRSNAISAARIKNAHLRNIMPPGFLITVACHSAAEIAQAGDADYALLAPIFSPRSKVDTREPLGLETLRRIAGNSTVPILSLGGITSENAALCLQAGAAGVAAITLFRAPPHAPIQRL